MNKNKIKISIIIPVYNTAIYLTEAVQSILNQTLKETEIIIINDGSTDNSIDILNELFSFDARITIFSFEKNAGLSISRNIGLKHAKGEYIYFFDSDDILEVDCLETCYKRLKITDSDVLLFDGISFSDNDVASNFRGNYQRTHLLSKNIYNGVELTSLLLKKKAYSSSVCLYISKKSYLDEIQLFFLDGILYEDILYTTQLFLSTNNISFVHGRFFHRRIREHSIMTSKITIQNIQHRLIIAQELLNIKMKYNDELSKKVLNQQVISMFLFLIKNLIRSGQLRLLLKFCFPIGKLIVRSL